MNNPVRIAHAYGNNLRSLRAAMAASIDVIEADIWFRSDDIFVRHEPRLGPLPLLLDRRMRGHPRPPMSLPLSSGYYVRPDTNRLRLGELLDTVRGKRKMLLDVKGNYSKGEVEGFVRTLARELSEHGAEDSAEQFRVGKRVSWPAAGWSVRFQIRDPRPVVLA